MTVYKAALLKLLDRLSDESIKRLYQLAQYLYVYKEQEVRHDGISSAVIIRAPKFILGALCL